MDYHETWYEHRVIVGHDIFVGKEYTTLKEHVVHCTWNNKHLDWMTATCSFMFHGDNCWIAEVKDIKFYTEIFNKNEYKFCVENCPNYKKNLMMGIF